MFDVTEKHRRFTKVADANYTKEKVNIKITKHSCFLTIINLTLS